MTLEEFEGATEKELREKANECFALSENAGTGDKPYLYLQAQFYLNEIQRREHDRERQEDKGIAKRDFRLEKWVIGLIGLEILLSVFGLWLGWQQGKDEARMMEKQDAILSNLEAATQATANQLKEELAIQYRTFLMVNYDGSRRLILTNSSKTEVSIWGFAFGNGRPKMLREGPTTIPATLALVVPIEDYYPNAFNNVKPPPPSAFRLTVYMKNPKDEEYVWQGKINIWRVGDTGIAGTVEGSSEQQAWSTSVKFSPAQK